jgi:hypothetical protein
MERRVSPKSLRIQDVCLNFLQRMECGQKRSQHQTLRRAKGTYLMLEISWGGQIVLVLTLLSQSFSHVYFGFMHVVEAVAVCVVKLRLHAQMQSKVCCIS